MRAVLLACGVVAASVPPAFADRITIEYRARAFGVAPLGAATLDIDVGDDDYRIVSTVRSGGLLALFDQTELTAMAEGAIEAAAVRSGRYDLDHRYARKHRVTTLRWTAAGVEAAIAPTYRLWGDPPVSDAQRRGARDPLSSLVAMSVAVGRSGRCEGAYPTFDGRFHYVLSLERGRAARMNEAAYSGPVLRCGVRYEPVSGFEASDGGRRLRTRRGEIWFATDAAGFAPPVRFSAPLPLGEAGVYMQRMRRITASVEPAQTAPQ